MSDNELVLLFFSMFSRYEYAMKAAGHVHAGSGDAAEPDWAYIDQALRELVNKELERLQEEAGTLVTDPPRKQVYRNGTLHFAPTGSAGDAAANLTVWLRRVRNNLFHGGKYSREFVLLDGRSRELIRCSISLLNGLLTASTLTDVAERFYGYGPPEGQVT
jgi:hypothetical protein